MPYGGGQGAGGQGYGGGRGGQGYGGRGSIGGRGIGGAGSGEAAAAAGAPERLVPLVPPIDTLHCFTAMAGGAGGRCGAAAVVVPVVVRQMIAQQIDMEVIRRAEEVSGRVLGTC